MSSREELEKMEIEEFGEKKEKKNLLKEKEDNVIETSYWENENYILEQIYNPITTTTTTLTTLTTHAIDVNFVIFDKNSGSTEIVSEFNYNNLILRPIIDDILRKKAVLLPSGVEEYENTKEIVAEIEEFISDYVDLPKFYNKFFPYLILFYWVYEKFPFVPYVNFIGLTGTGKTTAMEALGNLCYKSIDTTGSITMSSIFRTVTSWKGTMLIDEFSGVGENYREMISFLKSGVSDKVILRTEGDKKREVCAYIVKCPKIFTSETPISDAGLRSRTIVVKMDKNTRRLPLYKLPDYYTKAEKIRNKLLLWRLRNLNTIDLSKFAYGFTDLEPFDRRVQQVITPIYYFSDDETKKVIVKFAKEQEKETLRERLDSIEGQIFQTISDRFPEITTISQIFETINVGRSISRQTSEKRIANIVRKIFGFDIKRMGDGNISTLVLDGMDKRIKELRVYYGIPIPKQRVVSVGSVVDEAKEIFDL